MLRNVIGAERTSFLATVLLRSPNWSPKETLEEEGGSRTKSATSFFASLPPFLQFIISTCENWSMKLSGTVLASAFLLSKLFVVVQAQSCTPGAACSVGSFNGLCAPDGICGGTGARCGEAGFCNSGIECGVDGVCGSVGSYCGTNAIFPFFGDGSQFCYSTPTSPLHCNRYLCSLCPDGTTAISTSPYCSCDDGTTYLPVSGLCGCPSGQFEYPAGSKYCFDCPAGSNYDPFDLSCDCGSNQVFVVDANGVGSCECTGTGFFKFVDARSGLSSCQICPLGSNSGTANTPDCTCTQLGYWYNPLVNQCITNDDVNTCSGNQYSPGGTVCVECTNGLSFGHYCECLVGYTSIDAPTTGYQECVLCPSGSGANANYGGCFCPTGEFYFSDNTCVSCPSDATFNPNESSPTDQCICTTPNSYYDPATNTCTICPPTLAPVGVSCGCVNPTMEVQSDLTCRCPSGAVCSCPFLQYLSTAMVCEFCPSGSSVASNGRTCVCDPSQYFDPTSASCLACPKGSQTSAGSPSTCVCIRPNEFLDSSINQCSCGFNSVLSTATPAECKLCPSGSTFDGTTNSCDCGTQTPPVVFNPLSVTCDAVVGPTQRSKKSRREALHEEQRLLGNLKGLPWQLVPPKYLCSKGETPCAIPPRLENYECINIMTEIESCGGCVSTNEGVNCFEVPGVLSSTCDSGICKPLRCRHGWKLSVSLGGRVTCDQW